MWQYRFDLVFSYWIFAWWVLYRTGWVRQSPKLALILGLLENLVLLVLMVFIQGAPFALVGAFIIINTVLKVWPLYTVLSDHVYLWHDLITLFNVFALYLVYVYFASGLDNLKHIMYLKEFYEKRSATARPSLEATPGLAVVFELFRYMGWKWA